MCIYFEQNEGHLSLDKIILDDIIIRMLAVEWKKNLCFYHIY